jgi:hypothetical protein
MVRRSTSLKGLDFETLKSYNSKQKKTSQELLGAESSCGGVPRRKKGKMLFRSCPQYPNFRQEPAPFFLLLVMLPSMAAKKGGTQRVQNQMMRAEKLDKDS